MKLITVLVNDRVDHIVNFDACPQNFSANSYVIQNDGGPINLLEFYADAKSNGSKVTFQTDTGKTRCTLRGLKFEKTENPTDQDLFDCSLTVNFFLDEKQEKAKGLGTIIDNNYWDDNTSQIRLNPADPNKRYHINVEFNIAVSQKEIRKSTFTLYVIPKQFIHDIVLDYGSEASQLLVYNRAEGGIITINNTVPLFELFSSALGCNCEGDYLQKDSDNGNFYRTNFLIRRSPKACAPYTPIKDNKNIKFLTLFSEIETLREKYLTIPNIKVAGHGGVRVPTFSVNGVPVDIFKFNNKYCYRTIINSFMQQAIRSSHPINNDSTPAYYNVFLLMPNVYTQDDITQNLRHAADDIMNLASNIKEFSFVKGVETSSVSESDASFIGFMSLLPTIRATSMQSGKYLIMDAGKGTLDFSVLQYSTDANASHKYKSIFRSGIIGAGNAITYSFALAILYEICTKTSPSSDDNTIKAQISDFICNKITATTADEAELCQMINLLESYKAMYNDGLLDNNTFPANIRLTGDISTLDLTGFNNIIEQFKINRYLVCDTFVINMMATLAFDAAVKIKESYGSSADDKISRVVFAGRGFLMKKFKEIMLEKLKDVNKDICEGIEEVPLSDYPGQKTGASYKNLCLYVVEALSSGKYNGKLIGTPKVICHKDTDTNTDKGIDDRTGKFTWFFKFFKRKKEEKCKQENNSTKKISLRDIPAIIWRKLKECIRTLTMKKSDTVIRISNDTNRNLVLGFPVKITTTGDQIVFGGLSYKIPRVIGPGVATIFFDGCDFVIRQEDSGKFAKFGSTVDLNAEHIFESSFPYGGIVNEMAIPFPSMPDMSAYENRSTKDNHNTDEICDQYSNAHCKYSSISDDITDLVSPDEIADEDEEFLRDNQ